jgi:hypothetical protein
MSRSDERGGGDGGHAGWAVEAAAGAVAAAVCRCVVAPLDLIKIRLQLQRESAFRGTHGLYTSLGQAITTVWRQEGLASFWRCGAAREAFAARRSARAAAQ